MRVLCPVATAVLIAAAMSGCASSSPKATPKEAPPLMSQRMEQRWKRPDMSRRSIYDPEMKASFSKKSESGGFFSKKSYNSNQYAGTSGFNSGKGDYVVPGFASGKSAEYLRKQSFTQAGKDLTMSKGDYVVPSNTYGEQKSVAGSKSFSGSKDEYNTGSFYPAEKSQHFNRQPVILKTVENEKGSAYTEEQVRHLLGRP